VIVGISAFAGAFLKQAGVNFDPFLAIEIVVVMAALAIYCIWMALRLSLAFPACIVEKLGALPTLKRSISLTNGTMGRIFILYLLGTVLNYLVSMVVIVPILIVAALIPGANSPAHADSFYAVVARIAECTFFAVQALIKPVYGIALVVFYYDQRVRLEGFDIEWMMLRAGLVVPQSPIAPESDPETPPSSAPETSPPPEPV